jgi:hypothetical protein
LLIRIEYSIRRWLMSHGIWPPSHRQRTLSMLMVILAATGYRRWLSRLWQWSLRDYMVIVAVCSAGLLVSRSPMPIIVFVTTLAGAVLACLSLARHGFKYPGSTSSCRVCVGHSRVDPIWHRDSGGLDCVAAPCPVYGAAVDARGSDRRSPAGRIRGAATVGTG